MIEYYIESLLKYGGGSDDPEAKTLNGMTGLV